MPSASITAPTTAPYDRGWPLIGHSLQMIQQGPGFLQRMRTRHGKAFRVNAFGMDITFLLGPDANQLVLTKAQLFESQDVWEYLIGPFFHRGLMLMDGGEHRLHRRIMQTAFTKQAMADYLTTMQPRITADLAQWQVGERVRIFDRLKQLTLNIGSEVFVGHAPGAETDAMNRAFLDTVRAGTALIRHGVPGGRWRKGLQGRAYLEQFFAAEIALKRAKPGIDLFSRLCEAQTEEGELFSDEDVISHMIFVLMAAHDTSTITLTNMMYWLAKHPEWQQRLREQSQALGKAPLDQKGLAQLTDADLVMKEALRLCSPLPSLPRTLTQTIEFEGYELPAGSKVGISAWDSHFDAKYWSQPYRFDPERFSPERAEDKQHRFLWIPFGGGAHKCIGLHFGELEVKSIIHQLLLNFRWSVPQGYEIEQDFTSLPIPKDRLPVRLQRL